MDAAAPPLDGCRKSLAASRPANGSHMTRFGSKSASPAAFQKRRFSAPTACIELHRADGRGAMIATERGQMRHLAGLGLGGGGRAMGDRQWLLASSPLESPERAIDVVEQPPGWNPKTRTG